MKRGDTVTIDAGTTVGEVADILPADSAWPEQNYRRRDQFVIVKLDDGSKRIVSARQVMPYVGERRTA